MSKMTTKFAGVKFLPQAKRLREAGDFASQNYTVDNVVQWKEGEQSRSGKPYKNNGGLIIVKLEDGQTVSLFIGDLVQAQKKTAKAKFIKSLTGDDTTGYNGEVMTSGTISVVDGQIGL